MLLATQGFAALGLVTADYVLPKQFLPIDGGNLNYAGVDAVTYASLPTDGVSAINRAGATIFNVATNFAGTSKSVSAQPATVVEYYNPSLDHFFVSDLEPDIDALDSGRIAGWVRTGNITADTTTGACPAGTIPVYRLWNQRADSNHRYTADLAIKAQMLAKGYVAEGYGPDSVIMCAPV